MKARPILMSAPMIRALLDGRKTQTRRVVKPQPSSVDYVFSTIASTTGKKSEVGKHHWVTVSPDRLRIIDDSQPVFSCPYGQPGDQLWVRETWGILHPNGKMAGMPTFEFERYTQDDYTAHFSGAGSVVYKADGKEYEKADGYKSALKKSLQCAGRWRPSIHMPRWASRLTLELTDVRVERLQAISDEDCFAEGIDPETDETYLAAEHYRLGGVSLRGGTPERCAYAALWESINGPGSWDANQWVWVLTFRVHQINVNDHLRRMAA